MNHRKIPEQIISKLRKAEVALAQGKTVGQTCRRLGISEQSYYRWRKEYGDLKMDKAKRLKELEKENGRLRQAVLDLTLGEQILEEILTGNYQAPMHRRSNFNDILITEDVVRFFIPGHPFAIKSDDDEIICHPRPRFGVVRPIGPMPINYTTP